jgi:hypothetical protein
MNTTQMIGYLSTPAALEALTAIYPGDAPRQARATARWPKPTGRASARPRGFFSPRRRAARRLPATTPTTTTAGCWPPPSTWTPWPPRQKRPDTRVTLHSEGYEAPFIVDLEDLDPVPAERETTHSLIRGVAARMAALGHPWAAWTRW